MINISIFETSASETRLIEILIREVLYPSNGRYSQVLYQRRAKTFYYSYDPEQFRPSQVIIIKGQTLWTPEDDVPAISDILLKNKISFNLRNLTFKSKFAAARAYSH